ncbi:MAG: hypothetical protein ACR2FY_15565 [Pirellulaceae bacterium]
MATTLHWRVSLSTSALHAAAALLRGEAFADQGLATAVAESAVTLQSEILTTNLPNERFWTNLLGLSSGIESNRDLARMALTKTIGRGVTSDAAEPRIAAAITSVEGAVSRYAPKMAEELPLRLGPLREQWEARGPGFLRTIGLLTEEALLVEQAEVVVMHPALGGSGVAWMAANQVRMEGVLANPHPHLPEVVRLGWLIAQLNLDLPALSENVQSDRLPRVAQLAMLPAALAAGQLVELCQDSPELLGQALNAWHLAADAIVLTQWWETYCDSRPPFAVAIAALDKMLD